MAEHRGYPAFTGGIPVLAACLLLAGCASTKVEIPPGTKCRVTTATAGLYKYGPAQSFGPDQTLNPGAEVTMLERGFGFSRVMLENGVTGYVATDAIEPMPPEPPAPKQRGPVVTHRKLPSLFTGPVRRSNVESTPGDPLFDMSDTPLPVKDDPKPAFRAAPPKDRPSATPPEKTDKKPATEKDKKKDNLPSKPKE